MNTVGMYHAFSSAFATMKSSVGTAQESEVIGIVVSLLKIQKKKIEDQGVTIDQQHEELRQMRDFYWWLTLQCLQVSTDPSLSKISPEINKSFFELLNIYIEIEPIIFIDVVNKLVDSLDDFLDPNGYNRSKSDTILSSKVPQASFGKKIFVGDIRPICNFFLSLVGSKTDDLGKLGHQPYTFKMLSVMTQIFEISDSHLTDKIISLFPHLVKTVLPGNYREWTVMYSVFMVYHNILIKSQNVSTKFLNSLQESLAYIVTNFSTYDHTLALLMFVLTAEAAHIIACSDSASDLTSWVNSAVTLTNRIDFKKTRMDSIIPKLLATYRKEFVLLIGTYLLKTLEVDMEEPPTSETKESTDVNRTVIVENKSPTWRFCLEVLQRVPGMFFSSDRFEHVLELAAELISMGKRISSLLKFKYKPTRFELFNSRCLRLLATVPLMSNKFVKEPRLPELSSFARYVKELLFLFAQCQDNLLEDTFMIDHAFVIFMLPWQQGHAEHFSATAVLDCLDGFVNLAYIIPQEKLRKYVKLFSTAIFKEIERVAVVAVLKKFLSCLVLLAFRAPHDIIFELLCILRKYLMPDNFQMLLNNEYVGHKLLCFLSNTCTVKMGPTNWELLCVDCDALGSDVVPSKFDISGCTEYIPLQFLDLLQNRSSPLHNLNRVYLRFVNHSKHLRTVSSVKSLFIRLVDEPKQDPVLLSQLLYSLVYNSEEEINTEIIRHIYQTICGILKKLKNGQLESATSTLHSIIEIAKILLKLPYPNSMTVFKMLMVHTLSPVLDTCSVRALFKIALSSREKTEDKFCELNELELAEFTVDYIIHRANTQNTSVATSFLDIMDVLGKKRNAINSKSTLMTSILTEIIKKCKPHQSAPFIAQIAAEFYYSIKYLLDQHYESIFACIYCLEDTTIFKENLIPLFDSCGLSIESCIERKYAELVIRLVVHSHHPLKLFRFLYNYHQNNDSDNHLKTLQDHFIGCLSIIEARLQGNESLQTAKSYIAWIHNCIEMLGPDVVTENLVKLLKTLRTCLPLYYDTLPQHCLKAWTYFCFSVDEKKIGTYVPTILIHILPLLEKFPDDVSNIFYYFVVTNGVLYPERLQLLYFTPCYPNVKMQQVWCVIQSALLVKGSCCRNIVTILESIGSESIETKKIALERLRMCLSEHASRLNKPQIRGNDDKTAKMILNCLLDNINSKSEEVKTLCGACLGELGAIDPVKFGFNDTQKAHAPRKYNLAEDDFSILCMSEIIHCLRKYDDSNITFIVYGTLQELLRLHLQQKTDPEKSCYLEKFSSEDRLILIPLMHSKYILPGVSLDRKNLPTMKPDLHAVKTPCEWAAIWATHLLSRMPPSTQRAKLSTCLSAMKIDIDVTKTVLPYILLYSLLTSNADDVDSIEREMKYILQWDMTKYRTKPDSRMALFGSLKKTVIHSYTSQTKYLTMMLDLLDFLNQVRSDYYFSKVRFGLPNEEQFDVQIKDFVARFPARAVSLKSFMQEDYCRALYYLEKDSANEQTVRCVKPLRNIYAKLNDIDGLDGVVKSSNSVPSTEEDIVNHMISGRVQDALSGYELMCSKYQSTNTYRGLIQCYTELKQPLAALTISKHIMNGDKYLKPDIFNEHLEALWNSSCYEEIDLLNQQLSSTLSTWSIDSVGLYQLLTKPDYNRIVDKLKQIRLHVVNNLTDLNRSQMTLYRQGYWYMVKLHILNDIEAIAQMHFTHRPMEDDETVFKETWDRLDERLAILPAHGSYLPDVRKSHLQTLENYLNTSKPRLTNLVVNNISSYSGSMWLDLAKEARKNRCLQEAYTCIGIAKKYEPPELFIEMAKYHQAKSETDKAVMVLKHGLQQTAQATEDDDENTRKIHAKACLLIAQFEVGSMNLDFNDGYLAFKKAADICNLEKSFVRLATYLYRQHISEREPDNSTAKRLIQLEAARNFSKSLLFGTKYIYQSMPCILSLWLDYAARISIKKSNEYSTDVKREIMKILNDFNSLMENNILLLPTFMFMTAFSQILSRINHQVPVCLEILKKIIIKIMRKYPQQAMWYFYSVSHSKDAKQRARTNDICKQFKALDNDHARFFKVFEYFAEKLIDICMKTKPLAGKKSADLNQICPKLQQIIREMQNVPIMLPLQKLLTIHIGNCMTGLEAQEDQHTVYPLKPIYITDVKPNVLVLVSLQTPVRLDFVGSDGETYSLMCKRDDLRLDSRFMELNSIINSLLRTDSAASERGLTIRTYSVVPLNAECGIIEWLDGLSSLKSVMMDMYEKLNIKVMTMTQLKKLMYIKKDEVLLPERQRRFVDEILPKHPPVLHKWFFERHPCPEEWLQCRNNFVRTTAVMSIVGYIVGLGDRHGENILINSASGEAVHVDFSMLFNRGESLTYPETVPFRLTHNMVRAMGPTGVEGLFVKSAETTARVVRHNSDQLLSVLKPFLYDTDVISYHQKRHPVNAGEPVTDISNREAKINIDNVEMRLNGVVRYKSNQWAPHSNSKPLSVEGQTRMLIKEATSVTNLCQMFVGWAPYH